MSDQVLISKRLAAMLGYGVGDRISVYFIGEQVRVRRLVISGLYDIQLEDLDERLALMDIRQIRLRSVRNPAGGSGREAGFDGHTSDTPAQRLG